MACMWWSEGNFVDFILFSLYLGLEYQTQVIRLEWEVPLPMEPSCPLEADVFNKVLATA